MEAAQNKIGSINALVADFNISAKRVKISFAFGVLGALIATPRVFLAFKAYHLASSRTLRRLGKMQSLAGFGIAGLLALKQMRTAQKIRKLSAELRTLPDTQETKTVDDDDFSSEEKERMKSHFLSKDYRLRYRVQVTYENQLRALEMGYFSAKSATILSVQKSSNLEDLKAQFGPWRELLRDVTKDDSTLKVTDAEKSIIAKMCDDDVPFKEVASRNDEKSMTYARNPKTLSFKINNSSQNITKAAAFRQFLEENFKA